MKRGSIVLFREKGSPAGKSRPCIVIQHAATLADANKITAVPLTSSSAGNAYRRPALAPNAGNGLQAACTVQVDWVYTFSRTRLGPTIGEADPEVMPQIDEALRRWLDL